MSTSMFNRHRGANTNTNDQTNKHRVLLATITDEDHADLLCDSNSTEPSLANSSVSNVSSSTPNELDGSRQQLQSVLPLHSTYSLLDMTRDDSHDDDNNVSADVNFNADGSYRSPNSSLLDEDDEDEHEEEGDAVTVVERSIANISASLSGSFCTRGDEVGNPCTIPSSCTNYISDNIASQKVLFSDKILQDRIMKDLNYLLGSSATPCCTEKSLFSDCFGISDSTPPMDPTQTNVETKIRNRAGESWRARAYRIKRLREERMIQDSSWISKSGNLLTDSGTQWEKRSMSRSTSFQHQKFAVSKPISTMTPMQEVNFEPLGCMIGDCIEPISPLEGDDLEVEWRSRQEYIDEQDLCYDSDPGISSHSTDGLDAVITDGENVITDGERDSRQLHGRSRSETFRSAQSSKKKWFKSPRRRRRKMHFDSFDDSIDQEKVNTDIDEALDLIRSDFYGNGSDDISQDEKSIEPITVYNPRSLSKRANTMRIDYEIRTHVQDALNETWTLTWHLPPRENSLNKKNSQSLPASMVARKTSVTTPRCIQLWFERGNRVRRNDIVEPKLMWRDAYHPDLVSQRKLNISTTKGPHQICLLSICRIVEARTIDQKKYPFAKPSCSFIIRTSDDEEFVFETINQKVRDEIVYTWKLVVARLASQAVVGDGEGMVGEFFVPSSFGVP